MEHGLTDAEMHPTTDTWSYRRAAAFVGLASLLVWATLATIALNFAG
jgi:hypothetical protein